MRLLFLHGAGGHDEDRPLADGLGRALGCAVDMPRLPDEDMSVEGWAGPVRRGLATMRPDDLVVAHSFGASILLGVLARAHDAPRTATMLAMPCWSPEGWDVPDYDLEGAEPSTALTLHHCRDDAVVPFAHLALHAARLPSARVRAHDTGGHQLVGLVDTIVADLAGRG